MQFDTLTIHGTDNPDPAFGAVTPPLYLTSTFAFEAVGKPRRFDYSRSGNPTRAVLEETLARLDQGTHAFVFGSGMAAEVTVLSLLSGGDHLLLHHDLYGGTHRLVTEVCARQMIEVTTLDLTDLEAVRGAIRSNTRALWFESVTNPLIDVLDVRGLVALSRERGVLSICDNTFLSPCFFRPLELGVDVVLHSTTKYLNGHSDVVGGAVVVRDQTLAERLGFLQNTMGTAACPFDCFLVQRGIKTLSLRMARHDQSAQTIAAFLAEHPKVSEVFHPALTSHPRHLLAAQQFSGYGGTFSFRLRGGDAALRRFLESLRLFCLAESLGGVESLIEQPYSMTHVGMSEAARKRAGITEDLIRISVGLEDIRDLLADLEQALSLA